jgi:hypothetical protein
MGGSRWSRRGMMEVAPCRSPVCHWHHTRASSVDRDAASHPWSHGVVDRLLDGAIRG